MIRVTGRLADVVRRLSGHLLGAALRLSLLVAILKNPVARRAVFDEQDLRLDLAGDGDVEAAG